MDISLTMISRRSEVFVRISVTVSFRSFAARFRYSRSFERHRGFVTSKRDVGERKTGVSMTVSFNDSVVKRVRLAAKLFIIKYDIQPRADLVSEISEVLSKIS